MKLAIGIEDIFPAGASYRNWGVLFAADID